MPYKDYERQKKRARDRYHEKVHGVPAPPARIPRTEEERRVHLKEYFDEYRSRPEVKLRQHSNALKRLYGITWEDKVRMYQEQQGLCGLCSLPLPAEISRAHVDHNHLTGEVRKLLHKHCNTVVAFFEEDSIRINSLLDYLVR